MTRRGIFTVFTVSVGFRTEKPQAAGSPIGTDTDQQSDFRHAKRSKSTAQNMSAWFHSSNSLVALKKKGPALVCQVGIITE